ncbi:MAG: hypothetical protein LBR77_03680 [Lachnospiraceae bacterium]|nr:hypothetical protein [Lachnospiraceae bacterium]
MDDDMNTADGLAALFEMVKLANSTADEGSSAGYIGKMKSTLETLCDVLGIIPYEAEVSLDSQVEEMIERRQAARKAKDFKLADQIRDELAGMGIALEDTKDGVKWKRK